MINVVFSSFNGERTLGITLAAFCNLTVPRGGWKLITVDNGSTDSTADIMKSFVGRLPMQVLTIPSRGKNFALNEALKHVDGDLVVFTDDDIIPDPKWLYALENCARANPGCDVFGGPIIPHWPRAPDAWILNHVPMGMVYAASDPGIKSGPVDVGFIWGPNMAIRKTLFDAGVRFNTAIGPDGTAHYAMGSEYELTRRLAAQGIQSWFCTCAKVEHIVRENQLSKEWVLQRFFRHGRSLYLLGDVRQATAARIFGVERWLYRKMVLSYCKAISLQLLGQSDRAFLALQTYHRTKGMIFQSRLLHANKGAFS